MRKREKESKKGRDRGHERERDWEIEEKKVLVNFLFLTTTYRHVGPNVSFASKILDELGLIAAKSIILRPWKNNSNCCIAEWMLSLTMASP